MGETKVRVRYEETDQMGVVYHANYLVWLEMARTELLRDEGYSYKQLEEMGLVLPVVNVNCNYHGPAKYDDVLTIKTEVVELKRTKIKFSYEIYNQADKLLTTATTLHAFINKDFKAISLKKELPEVWEVLKSN